MNIAGFGKMAYPGRFFLDFVAFIGWALQGVSNIPVDSASEVNSNISSPLLHVIRKLPEGRELSASPFAVYVQCSAQ